MWMRKRAVYLLVVICIILTGCFNSQRTSSSKSTAVKAPKPITLNVAKKLIGDSNLTEITTKEVWQKMHAQVFSGINNSTGNSYLIKDTKVIKLCSGFGGAGIHSMVVSDLNHDKQPELIFIYTWGSGVNGTEIRVYTQGTVSRTVFGSLYEEQYYLKKRDDQTIEVITSTPDNRIENAHFPYPPNQIKGGVSIGKIISKENKGRLIFKVELYKDIPKEIKDILP